VKAASPSAQLCSADSRWFILFGWLAEADMMADDVCTKQNTKISERCDDAADWSSIPASIRTIR
jgi:hypothetical protein